MKHFSAIALIVLVGACAEPEDRVKDLRDPETIVEDEFPDVDPTPEVVKEIIDSPETVVPTPDSEWSYKVISISENNWGYQIFQKGSMVINQTSIPSVQGVNGFDTEEKAERTAKHILNKVENGTFPPTVDKEELENLGVLRD
ncbi:MAG: DUF4907 domain-containing protein [Crocinitomicaceae bacterium]|nr:DUF4907 domain-containing protein [Crocinitomicaceae bacterium]